MTVVTPKDLFKKQGRGNGPAISVRIPDDLMQRLAKFGNAKGLTLAETVRTVLELGLDAAA